MLEIGVMFVFFGLLWIEWKYKLRSVRIGTVILALTVWLFFQPDYTTPVRRLFGASPEARVTELRGSPLSEYESGVMTLYNAIDDASDYGFGLRMAAMAVLTWLACSPAFRRTQGSIARPEFTGK